MAAKLLHFMVALELTPRDVDRLIANGRTKVVQTAREPDHLERNKAGRTGG